MISREDLIARLQDIGCVAAEEEATALLAHANDSESLLAAVARRAAGEPLAWIVGWTRFAGLEVRVAPGVYVPRWQTEWIAAAATAALPPRGVALDLCCGSGAVAMVLARDRPRAQVLGVDIDATAVACARDNGVDAHVGDLFAGVPSEWSGRVDVIVAVCPYVPTRGEVAATAEPAGALFGGDDGLGVVERVVTDSPAWLAPGGALVLEIGAPQLDACVAMVAAAGFESAEPVIDGDGDVTGVLARCPVGR